MYTMISASQYFAIDCWVTVFPAPNGPGIQPAPPLAIGKKVSIDRPPVRSGSLGKILLFFGRAARIGQY